MWVTSILAVFVLAYAGTDFLWTHRIFEGTVELIGGTILVLNTLWYRTHGNALFAKTVLCCTTLPLLLAEIPGGGGDGTGIFWIITYPPATYYFLGTKRANILNALMYVAIFAMMGLQSYGMLKTYYDINTFQQLCAVLAMSVALGYAIERTQSDNRNDIITSRGRLNAVLQAMPAGVIMVDRSGLPVAWNAGAEALLGTEVKPNGRVAAFASAYGLTTENGQPYPVADLPIMAAMSMGATVTKSDIFMHGPKGD
ncbi:MAG: hypothetical protein RLZZ324_747, partial [Candidatus Parcubacteria bacterium]